MDDKELARLKEYGEATNKIADDLLKKNPSLPVLTTLVMAGDIYSAQRAEKYLEEGMPFERAVNMVGSYARFDFAVSHAPVDWLHANLPELWRGSDPDDTDPRYLALWKAAYEWNGRKTITDGKPLPFTKDGLYAIYRGQRLEDPIGFAWTLDPDIAEKFARGSSFRTAINGSVIEDVVTKDDILAYLTGRGESEVIIDR